MKTSNTIFCSITGVVLVAVVLLAVRLWPQTLRDDDCSPLYQRYCHVPGVEASYVKGFQINDTLAIDATLLHATDSASWERLREELNLPKPTPKTAESIKKGKDILLTYLTKKGGTSQNMDKDNINNNDVVGVSYLYHSIGIYHTCSHEEIIATLDYNFEKSIQQQIKNNNHD